MAHEEYSLGRAFDENFELCPRQSVELVTVFHEKVGQRE
jgi:hypothetical protein